MTTADKANAPPDPLVMRWREPVADGLRHWYLASLRVDASFWGYVHIRTKSLDENRNFNGSLTQQEYQRIQQLIASIDGSAQPSEAIDGLVGVGTRGKFDLLLGYNTDDHSTPNAMLFREIVAVLQPKVTAAAL